MFKTSGYSNILELINNGENQTTEFKTSFQKEVIESIVAFANTKGGKVFIGVSDDGTVVGVELKQESLQNWVNQIKTTTQPSIIVDIEQITIEDKTVVKIEVNEYPVKPISYKNRYFVRKVNSNHLMSMIEISNMHLQSLQLSWDAYESNDTKLEDLDIDKIDNFFKRVNEKGRFKLKGTRNENLQKLNLLKDLQPTNAAKLLFAKEMRLYSVHIGRFKTPSMIIDDRMIQTTLFEAVEQVMNFILSHIKVAFEFTGEIERTEIFEYPQKALREIILNTIVHRDYTSPIDIQIKILDNSITIFNPGRLYGDISIEDLHTDSYQSQARNKLVTEAFYLTGDIEKYGSGYIRIREDIKNYPTMKFEYRENGNGYLVTISYTNQKVELSNSSASGQIGGQIGGQINLTPRQQEILNLIKDNSKITQKEMESKLKINRSAILKHLNNLKEKGVLTRVGGTRGYWEVIKNKNFKEETK